MWHRILGESSFFLLLQKFDQDLAPRYQAAGCGFCGGVLHHSPYPRKPRGPKGLPAGYHFRESFCCSRAGCRRRLTPPSVRFLARRVYLSAVVVLVSAMVGGITEKRAREMRELVGVSRRTLERWRRWWRESFVSTRLWKAEGARFVPPVERCRLPASLVERFREGADSQRALSVLRWLLPLTAGANCVMAV